MWPNGTARMPGISASHAAVARRMNSGTFDTGTDTSFLTLAPSRFCASECSSRSRQIAARCASLSAITASATMPSASACPAPLPATRAGRRRGAAWPAPPARSTSPASANGSTAPSMCRSTNVGAEPGHQFECADRGGIVRLEAAEQLQRRLRRCDGAQRDGDLARLRRQLQHRGGDDAERALGADEKLAQAVAGVVLAQPAQPVPHRAVRQHHLQPQHQVACVAVAHRVVAAGVGGQHAADLRAAFRGDRQRQQAAGLGRGNLRRLQRDAGLDRSWSGRADRCRGCASFAPG